MRGLESLEKFRVEIDGHVATVTITAPPVNAQGTRFRQEIVRIFDVLGLARDVRAIVLTGEGKAFSAGADLSERSAIADAPDGYARHNRLVRAAFDVVMECPKPVIAAVNGAASGLGADTALACDFIIASEWASFTWSYIHRGIIPDGGGMYFLPRRVGLAKAKDLIFTGRKVEADEALALGIVDRKTTADRLLADAQAWAAELGRGSATALALSKTILNQTFELPAQQVFAQGSQAQGICYTSTEHRESVRAFLAKTHGTAGE